MSHPDLDLSLEVVMGLNLSKQWEEWTFMKGHVYERAYTLQDRKLAAQGFSPVTYSLSANACAYNSPELSHRSNNDTIYLSSPEMQNAQYLTLPQLATTLPHGFQVPQSDGELPSPPNARSIIKCPIVMGGSTILASSRQSAALQAE